MQSRIPLVLTLCALIGLGARAEDGSATPAVPARSEQALEILRRADAAAKAVGAARYRASARPTGVAERFFAAAEGTVILVGWTDRGPRKFRFDARTKRPGSAASRSITGGSDGEAYFLIDHETKRAYADIDRGALGSDGAVLRALGMFELVHDHPFEDELAADTVELDGVEEIDGEACHKIRVVYAVGRQETTWYIAQRDSLPRRSVQTFTTPGGAGSVDRTISALEVDPALDDGLFALQLPEGYTRIDDFAP